jgi:hypothetical protein
MTRSAKLATALGASVLILQVVPLRFPLEYDVDCSRSLGLCTLTQEFLTQTRVEKAPIESIERAEVQVGNGRWDRAQLRVRLNTPERRSAMVAVYGSAADAAEAAERINAFLGDPHALRVVFTKRVNTIYWSAWLLVPVGAAFLVALMAALFPNRHGETVL